MGTNEQDDRRVSIPLTQDDLELARAAGKLFNASHSSGFRVTMPSSGDDHPEIEMKAVVDAQFAAGKGVLVFSKDTPDEVILDGIKQGIAAGKPFTVIPA